MDCPSQGSQPPRCSDFNHNTVALLLSTTNYSPAAQGRGPHTMTVAYSSAESTVQWQLEGEQRTEEALRMVQVTTHEP